MTTLLFFHLVGVITLFSALALEFITLGALKRARDVEGIRRATTFAPLIGKLAPAGVLLILSMGIAMVADSKEFAFGDAWVVMALILVVVLSVAAPGVHGKRIEALARAAEESPGGPLTPDLLARLNDPVMQLSAMISSFLAIGIVWLMTHQPGWTGTVVTVVVAAAIGAAIGVAMIRRPVVVPSIVEQRTAPLGESTRGRKSRSKASVD